MISIPIINVLELGLIYGLVALGVYLSFRVINFPDLSVDGTFPLGAAVVAILLTNGVNPIVATFVATMAGMLAGSVTACLHVYFRIMNLLAGILTMTALYSINIRVMGRPNIALLDITTIFSSSMPAVVILACLVMSIVASLRVFLASQYGLGIRAAGMNPAMSQSYGVNIKTITILTMAISNGLVALSGALFAQLQGFADVSLGTGTVVIGLASIMIGEAILGTRRISFCLMGCVVGSLLYRLVIAVALNSQVLGLQASDLNLITAGIVTLALVVPKLGKKS